MMRELTEEDFARAVKNPYFEKLHKKVEVYVKNEDYEYIHEVANMNSETPEQMIRRILRLSVERMREMDDE